MKSNLRTVIRRAIRKASSSPSRYKIAAIGIDHRSRVIGITFNRPRHMPHVDQHRSNWRGSGYHAEELLLHRLPRSLRRIYIARVNSSGTRVLPIHPCSKCLRLAEKFGVKIEPLLEVA